jgi:alkylation response protein AidB-like acyl-CoA dehydrogenase
VTDLDDQTIDTEIVAAAPALADDVLFPGALETDEADLIPVERLDALADRGFYGVLAPRELGGLGANMPTMTAAVEAVASGCLTTGLVWCQHFGLLGNVVFGTGPLHERYAEDAARGRVRGGIAFGGLLPGPPVLTAAPLDGGWVLDGRAPWVSGWGRIDLLHVAARGPDDTVVNVLIDAAEADGVRAERLRLAAVDASATVHVTFDGLVVAGDRVMSVQPYDPAGSLGSGLRMNGSLALGVAARCCALIGPSPLDQQLVARRDALDAASAEEMATERARTSAFAMQAATALMAHVGSRAILREEHAQRLAREAQFLLIFGNRPMIREALLAQLTRAGG